jgi:hypothetical protein
MNSHAVGIQRALDTRVFLSRSRKKRPAMPSVKMRDAMAGGIHHIRAHALSRFSGGLRAPTWLNVFAASRTGRGSKEAMDFIHPGLQSARIEKKPMHKLQGERSVNLVGVVSVSLKMVLHHSLKRVLLQVRAGKSA